MLSGQETQLHNSGREIDATPDFPEFSMLHPGGKTKSPGPALVRGGNHTQATQYSRSCFPWLSAEGIALTVGYVYSLGIYLFFALGAPQKKRT